MIAGSLFRDQCRTAANVLFAVVRRSSVLEGCHATCRTACSWTRADISLGVVSIAHIQTMVGRV